MSKLERQSYQDELERLSEMTLELVEEYMSQMDLGDEDLNDNPFMWGGGNLGPEETDKKTYDEWLNHFGVDDDEEDDSISFSFTTAWAPPINAFETWARGQDGITFELKYFEGGVGFVGTTSYDGEYLDDDCVDSGSDLAEYRRIAQEDWGYEFEEEPEPLTEWYKDGVIAKGLTHD